MPITPLSHTDSEHLTLPVSLPLQLHLAVPLPAITGHHHLLLHINAFPGGALATARCSGHASKQAGKELRSQGHPHGAKRSRILATPKQTKAGTKTHQGTYKGGLGHGLG